MNRKKLAESIIKDVTPSEPENLASESTRLKAINKCLKILKKEPDKAVTFDNGLLQINLGDLVPGAEPILQDAICRELENALLGQQNVEEIKSAIAFRLRGRAIPNEEKCFIPLQRCWREAAKAASEFEKDMWANLIYRIIIGLKDYPTEVLEHLKYLSKEDQQILSTFACMAFENEGIWFIIMDDRMLRFAGITEGSLERMRDLGYLLDKPVDAKIDWKDEMPPYIANDETIAFLEYPDSKEPVPIRVWCFTPNGSRIMQVRPLLGQEMGTRALCTYLEERQEEGLKTVAYQVTDTEIPPITTFHLPGATSYEWDDSEDLCTLDFADRANQQRERNMARDWSVFRQGVWMNKNIGEYQSAIDRINDLQKKS